MGTLVHTVTIEDKISQIRTLLPRATNITFRSLLGDSYSRVEVIVTFLALLEMIRHHRVSVRQESLFGTIVIEADSRDGHGTQRKRRIAAALPTTRTAASPHASARRPALKILSHAAPGSRRRPLWQIAEDQRKQSARSRGRSHPESVNSVHTKTMT